MAIKLLIVLSIFLNYCDVSLVEGEEYFFDGSMDAEFETIIENNNDTWLVNFIRNGDNIYISCPVIPIEPRVFIGDSECIYHASKVDHWKIVIEFYHNSMRFQDMAFVQDKSIFYNTNLTSEYNSTARKIAILITDQPVVSDNNRTLLVGTAQEAYDTVPNYNEEKQIKKIAQNYSDIEDNNFSRCFMSPYQGRSISVQCFDLLSAYSMCHFKKTDYVISQYENLLGFLMCHVKSRKHKVLLAGVLSRVNKLTLDSYKREIDLKFENVDDLGEIIREKMRNWLAENPELNTYRLF